MTAESFLDGKITLLPGDCLDMLPTLAENSVDACVTDPPYGLEFMGKEWDKFADKPRRVAGTGSSEAPFAHHAVKLDGARNVNFQIWCEQWAREVYRVLKPGAHLLAFGGTRTSHRMACAIEDAGFEIRDTIMWIYGSGFPKSHSVAIAIEKMNGVSPRAKAFNMKGRGERAEEMDANGREFLPPYEPTTAAARAWSGWGTALKPACEIICLARKPLSESTVAANVLRWGTGAINVDGCRVKAEPFKIGLSLAHRGNNYGRGEGGRGTSESYMNNNGRWPANVIHDGSAEVLAGFPETVSGLLQTHHVMRESENISMSGKNYARQPRQDSFGDSGSAARFFYTAKADADDRIGSKHPTVKPLDLKQYLVRLICPRGGLVLDPFAGTGTTGESAWREGMRAILIEREAEYQDDIRRRMALCIAGPNERKIESIKARDKNKSADHGPLFSGAMEVGGAAPARQMGELDARKIRQARFHNVNRVFGASD